MGDESKSTTTELQYPDWVDTHLTPDLEVTKVTDPGKVELWLDPRQESDNKPTGNEVYEAHGDDRLKKALSFGHLQWYAKNPDQIPAKWREDGLLVYAWASVVRGAGGNRFVPYLDCSADQPYVDWYGLGSRWGASGPSGLLTS